MLCISIASRPWPVTNVLHAGCKSNIVGGEGMGDGKVGVGVSSSHCLSYTFGPWNAQLHFHYFSTSESEPGVHSTFGVDGAHSSKSDCLCRGFVFFDFAGYSRFILFIFSSFFMKKKGEKRYFCTISLSHLHNKIYIC